jgi:hypothetical protein
MTAPVNSPAPAAVEPGQGPAAPKRRGHTIGWIGVVVVTFSALIGGNLFGIRDYFFESATPEAVPPALGRTAGGAPPAGVDAAPTSLRSEPWWQDVTTVEGTGTASATAFTIRPEARQWRVTGTCQSGQIVVRAPSEPRPVLESRCGGSLTGSGTRSGRITLQVTADGPWRLTVAQLIDVPLVEPLSPGMTAPGSKVIASGEIYNIDKSGKGRVTVYDQADGRYSVRLDDFFVSPNSDLQLRFSTLEHPRSTEQYLGAKSETIAAMDVTAGSLNYLVPLGGDPTLYKSVVVWSPSAKSAYVAASLGVVR